MQKNPYESPKQDSPTERVLKMRSDRLLVAARIFLGLSIVPVLAMLYEVWAFTAPAGVQAGNRMPYYMTATACLAAFTGVLYRVHRMPSFSPLPTSSAHQ